jgi:hypothetical protein
MPGAQRGAHSGQRGPLEQRSSPVVQLGQQIEPEEQWWVPHVMLSVWIGAPGAVWEAGAVHQAMAAAATTNNPAATQVFNMGHLLSRALKMRSAHRGCLQGDRLADVAGTGV